MHHLAADLVQFTKTRSMALVFFPQDSPCYEFDRATVILAPKLRNFLTMSFPPRRTSLGSASDRSRAS